MKKAIRTAWRATLIVALLGAGVVAALYGMKHISPAPPPVPPPSAGRSSAGVFLLPVKGAGIGKSLGRTRDEVHRRLGPPAEVVGDVELYEVGVPVRLRYSGNVVEALLVTVANAAAHEHEIRAWLAVPDGPSIEVNGRRYVAAPLANEPDTLQITPFSDEPPAKVSKATTEKRPRRNTTAAASPGTSSTESTPAPPRLARLAAELLRGFPLVPDELVSRCRKSAMGPAVLLDCDRAVDVPVSYEYASDKSWVTLTILGPPNTHEKAACREWFTRNVSGAQVQTVRQENDELREYFARGKDRFLVSFLTRWEPKMGARCSIIACREDGRGRGRACRP